MSWKQLRFELCASFRAVRPDEVTSCDFHDLRQRSMTLQEYLQSVMKLHSRAPNVADQSIIDSVVKGINLGPCGEYISRRKPKTVTKLFEIMQEYCISDRAKRRRLEEKNEQKKSRSSERSHSKPWHADEPKQKRTVNNVSEEEPREHRHHHRGKGERDRHEERSNRDDRHHREERHNKGRRDNGGRRENSILFLPREGQRPLDK